MTWGKSYRGPVWGCFQSFRPETHLDRIPTRSHPHGMDRECWRLTQNLLARVDAGADQRLQAMAHLGAAVLLFERAGEREMVAAILGAVEEELRRVEAQSG